MVQLNIRELQAATAWDIDGTKLGEVSQVHLDPGSGQPTWVTVPLGLLNSREHFVPLRGAHMEGGDVYLEFARDEIADSPEISADTELSAEEEEELREFYGL